VRWHEGQTCVEYQEKCRPDEEKTAHAIEIAEQEEASKNLIDVLARKCPGSGCGVPIMQDTASHGCDKLKCK
jgi:hypothetical protein